MHFHGSFLSLLTGNLHDPPRFGVVSPGFALRREFSEKYRRKTPEIEVSC